MAFKSWNKEFKLLGKLSTEIYDQFGSSQSIFVHVSTEHMSKYEFFDKFLQENKNS